MPCIVPTACPSSTAEHARAVERGPHQTQPAASRRRLLVGAAAALGLGTGLGFIGGCAAPSRPDEAPMPGGDLAWRRRLGGTTLALLGEVHDNAEGHRRRFEVLRAAVEAGWRPAIVMEQFDTDRQVDIERSRRERPRDAAPLIAAASGSRSGWDWAFYEPVVALALAHGLPLLAGNLARNDAARVVREGPGPVLGDARARSLGLVDAVAPVDLAAGQSAEIEAGHCGMLPQTALPGMVRAQFARDAVMADVLRRHGASGAVLLAGNGHVRRDLGVPRWLDASAAARLLAIGFIESAEAADATAPAGRYDAVVIVATASREDPCLAFRKR